MDGCPCFDGRNITSALHGAKIRYGQANEVWTVKYVTGNDIAFIGQSSEPSTWRMLSVEAVLQLMQVLV